MLRPSPNHGTQRLLNDEDDEGNDTGPFCNCIVDIHDFI